MLVMKNSSSFLVATDNFQCELRFNLVHLSTKPNQTKPNEVNALLELECISKSEKKVWDFNQVLEAAPPSSNK